MHHGGKTNGNGRGKQGREGQCNHCGEWGHTAVQCQKRLTCGQLGCLGSTGEVENGGEQSHTSNGFLDKGFNKGYGKGPFSKGKGLHGKGATNVVLEAQGWSQWNGYTEGAGEGALALFIFTDGPAKKEPTTLSRSSEPMRVDMRDFTKPKKLVTSTFNTQKEKVKMQEQNGWRSWVVCMRTMRSTMESQRT